MADDCGLLNPFECATIPMQSWVKDGLGWMVDNYRPLFQAMKWPVDQVLRNFEWLLSVVPPLPMLILLALIAWQLAGPRMMGVVLGTLGFIGVLGVWEETMITLSVVLTALTLCLVIGIPLGILAARSDRFFAIIRPILDGMQTIPAFVYLVPIVMLFGIGNVPGVIVTVIFALPPVVRLTNLGIRQVPGEVVEAMLAFGASRKQLLWKAQLPLAMPSIMAGVNQTLMMSLSMVVIASMISVGGLGQMVLRGIGRLDMGIATVGGLGIVILAIVLDRLTQTMAENGRGRGRRSWKERGPVGAVRSAFGK